MAVFISGQVGVKTHEISSLTGIRAVMAYWVVCHHLLPVDAGLIPLHTLVARGATGVDVFFILSGFILTYTYQEKGISDRTFWLLRVARIYPIYLVGMILFTPFILMNITELHATMTGVAVRVLIYGLTTLMLVQAWLPQLALAWNGPGWSLSAEAFFYALFPYLLRLLKSRPIVFTTGAAGLFYLFYLLPYAIGHVLPENISGNSNWIFFVTFNPLIRIPEFIIGICLARLIIDGHGRFIARFTLLIFVAFVAVVSLIQNELIFRALSTPLICLLLTSLFYGSGPACRILASRPIVMLGRASYAVYILHIPVAYWFRWLATGDPKASFTVPDFTLFLATLTGLALLSYRYIEQPANEALRLSIKNRGEGNGLQTSSGNIQSGGRSESNDARSASVSSAS